jgi:hypothetical protein
LATHLAKIAPLMTAASTPSPYVVSASTTLSNWFPWIAFSGYTQDGSYRDWLASSATNEWVKIDLGSGNGYPALTKYSVGQSNTGSAYNATGWTLSGSNDDTTYTTIDTQTGQSFASASALIFTISPSVAYRYYKLTMSGSGLFVGTCDVGLYYPQATGGGVGLSRCQSGVVIQ